MDELQLLLFFGLQLIKKYSKYFKMYLQGKRKLRNSTKEIKRNLDFYQGNP